MCGIAGILRFDNQPIPRERLQKILAHLRHRGPDGEGVATLGRCTLLHTRLSILDLLGGNQPMHIPQQGRHGPMSLVFNGEIYNHRELRSHLEKLGHHFQSDHCDTEVLLHGYREWGDELPKRLHGMFAFAIWDQDTKRLFLCRDRSGKKPLYIRWYHSCGSREFLFASLAATLVAASSADAPVQINTAMLPDYLRFGYTMDQSLLQGVMEVSAAHWLAIQADGSQQSQQYWRPPPISLTSTRLGAVDATLEVLTEAVHTRLEADVPLGCFLSGGIDSSLIAALAQQHFHKTGRGRLRTFNVAMPDVDYDESAKAIRVARHLGTDHQSLRVDAGSQVISDLRKLIALSGEPTADSSILPSYWLSRTTREHVKVALSGDGGDELFGGYDRYRAMQLLERHHWWLRQIPLSRFFSPDVDKPRSLRTRLLRLASASGSGHPAQQYRCIIEVFNTDQISQLGLIDPPMKESLPGWLEEHGAVHAAMRWDLTHYLPYDLLRKVDRASMAVALEVRCPMLDTAVCDLAGHLPAHVLMPGGRAKGLLREVAGRFLPPEILSQKKRGFALPIGRWFRSSLHEPLRASLMEGHLASIGMERSAVETLLREHSQGVADHTHRLFSLLALSLWLDWLAQCRE